MDKNIDKWINNIKNKTENETTFIITSDHGENLGLGENIDMYGHTGSLSEGILHVPQLIINPPYNYPNEINDRFSHLDLGALITSLAEERQYQAESDSIRAELIGRSGGRPLRSHLTFLDRLIRCVYQGNEKIVWDSLGVTKVHNIDTNTANSQTLVGERPTYPEEETEFGIKIQDMKRKAVYKEINETETKLDMKTKQRLSELGYL